MLVQLRYLLLGALSMHVSAGIVSAPQPVQGAWVVDPQGMTLEDISANFAPPGALVDALVHSPKKTGIGPPIPQGPRVIMTPHSAEALSTPPSSPASPATTRSPLALAVGRP